MCAWNEIRTLRWHEEEVNTSHFFLLSFQWNTFSPGFRNHSTITEFILLGLSANPRMGVMFFVLFLWIYLLTLIGNLMMMTGIGRESHLHSPMYFFLSHLSFLDLCLTSFTVPKMLENLLSHRNQYQ